MMEIIRKVIQCCKEGGRGNMETPLFLDSMLRNYSSEDDTVCTYMCAREYLYTQCPNLERCRSL